MVRTAVQWHHSEAELEQRYRHARQGVERSRWQMVWLKRQGKTLEQITAQTSYKRAYIYRVLTRYFQHGETGIRDRRQDHGRAMALSETEQAQLAQALLEAPEGGGFWTAKAVQHYLQSHFGKTLSRTCAWSYFKRLGFSVQTPRPQHVQAATVEEQAEFKKKLKTP